MKRTLLIAIFLLAVFILAVLVWYSPMIFKGYPAQSVSTGIILAKNYHKTGFLAMENNQNIVISSGLIKEQGQSVSASYNLGSILYAKVFDIVGIPDYNNLILISIVLYSLALVLFTILVLYLFNLKTAIVFSLVYIFSSIGWGLSHLSGDYEFCLIFLALFFIFYFLGVKKLEQSQNKFYIPLFVSSGVFLALSGFSKEVSFVFAFSLFLFLFIKKYKKQLIYIFIPFTVMLAIFWLPSVLSGDNLYFSNFLKKQSVEESSFSSYNYLHLFPDPYTYYFEREEFLEQTVKQNLDWSEQIESEKIKIAYGFERITFLKRIKIGGYILSKHFFRFFSLEDFGGPFITLLLILGFIYLRFKYKFLYNLSLYWLIVSFLVFVFIRASRNHLMDFIWIIILLIVLGLLYLLKIIGDHFNLRGKKLLFISVAIIILLIYNLVLVNHVILGRQYDQTHIPRSLAYSQEINNIEINERDVIAIPGDFPYQTTILNYLTDKSFIIFQQSTLESLLEKKETNQAFKHFKVRYILGYSEKLSEKIVNQTGVINISSDSLKISIEKTSENKNFLMNLIR